MGPQREPVYGPLHRYGRRHPGPEGQALSHPGGGPGPAAERAGARPAADRFLRLAQCAGVGVLRNGLIRQKTTLF